MIIIMCDSYEQAEKLFSLFLDFLDQNEPQFIKKIFFASPCVEMEDGLKYLFIDWHYREWFEGFCYDFIDADEFFYGVDKYYGDEIGKFLSEWENIYE